MKAKKWNFSKKSFEGTVDLPDRLFMANVNDQLVYEAIKSQLANARQGNSSSKNRSDIIGSTKKPWTQKKTGRARAGSVKSPLWRGGGITFGPQPRSYRVDMPKKMRQRALFSVLSLLAKKDRVLVIENLSMDQYSTKNFTQSITGAFEDSKKIRAVLLHTSKTDDSQKNSFIRRSARNIPFLTFANVEAPELKDMFYSTHLLLSSEGLEAMAKIYSEKNASKGEGEKKEKEKTKESEISPVAT